MDNVVAVTRGVYNDGTLESVAAVTYKRCCGRGCLYILVGGNAGIIIYLTMAFDICPQFLLTSERRFGCVNPTTKSLF